MDLDPLVSTTPETLHRSPDTDSSISSGAGTHWDVLIWRDDCFPCWHRTWCEEQFLNPVPLMSSSCCWQLSNSLDASTATSVWAAWPMDIQNKNEHRTSWKKSNNLPQFSRFRWPPTSWSRSSETCQAGSVTRSGKTPREHWPPSCSPSSFP